MITEKHNIGAQTVLRSFRENCDFGGDTCLSNVGNSDISTHNRTLPPFLRLSEYWANKYPDFVIVKGWPQHRTDAGSFPAPEQRGSSITIIPMEYKTCDDFKFAQTLQENVYDKYSPNHLSPRPQRPNLLVDLRAKGWRVLGLNLLDNSVGDTPLHNSMLTVVIGHGAFLPTLPVRTVFRETLHLSVADSDKLALSLVRHQILSHYKLLCTADRERGAFTGPPTSSAVAAQHQRAGVG
jgi:hypothetical protein